MSDNVSFLINVNYERKTFKNTIEYINFESFDPVVNSELVDIKLRLEYLTIPLNLKYYLDTNKRFFINGGPFVGVFLNSQTTIEGNKSGSDASFLFKTLDFGANFGVGTRFKISEKYSLNLEVRHNYGLANISDVQVVNGGSVRTNAFNLIANWQFD
jgi:outer membrane protein W